RPKGPRAGSPQPVASIAPDDLEAFARDLRALRATADLEYPEMAETSHFEMKTLAAAEGGLRLPALPLAVAFVRACGGNVAEWEDRWQKLADRLTAEAARKRRGDGEENDEPVEPTDAPAAPEPPEPAAAPPLDPHPPRPAATARIRRRRGLRHHLGSSAPARLVAGTDAALEPRKRPHRLHRTPQPPICVGPISPA